MTRTSRRAVKGSSKRREHDYQPMVYVVYEREPTNLECFYIGVDDVFLQQFGFHIKETNIRNIVAYMHRPKHASSLAVTRILFGIAMLFDIPDERGGARMEERWGNPKICHFPLVNFIQVLPMQYMALVYAGLWFGALGIALGYKFHTSCATFTVCYWYLLLIEKSYWNNHSYLFGLVAFLLNFTRANCYWSLDAYQNRYRGSKRVPYWNYFLLKYQFFILYFMAGVKKSSSEWLTGYSVQNLSQHWVFDPFKLFLTVQQTDYLIVHWFVFVFDLTVAFWMMFSTTRDVAMFFCALFHLMNSRLFRIGMFPWVCLATMPLFYPFDWPKRVLYAIKTISTIYKENFCGFINKIRKFRLNNKAKLNKNCKSKTDENKTRAKVVKCVQEDDTTNAMSTCKDPKSRLNVEDAVKGKNTEKETRKRDTEKKKDVVDRKKFVTCFFIALYVFTQLFLPFSHFITKGYNNWINGLYGYSWDMMVHSWDVDTVVVKVVNHNENFEHFLDPYALTPNGRWVRHGDMVYQYAHCIKQQLEDVRTENDPTTNSVNISIYIDVWASLNGRYIQRMFDSHVDMLKVTWSPFTPVSYLMPLIDAGVDHREFIHKKREAVQAWNKYSEAVFYAEFPGYKFDKYIAREIRNVTFTVLEGSVIYEPQRLNNEMGKSYQLDKGCSISMNSGMFHKIVNVGRKPALSMFTYYNATEVIKPRIKILVKKLPILMELKKRFDDMCLFWQQMINYLISFNPLQCQ